MGEGLCPGWMETAEKQERLGFPSTSRELASHMDPPPGFAVKTSQASGPPRGASPLPAGCQMGCSICWLVWPSWAEGMGQSGHGCVQRPLGKWLYVSESRLHL